MTSDLAGNALDLSKVYFIKALAYNATGIDFPTNAASITEAVLRGRRFSDIRMAASLPAGAGGAGGTLTFELRPSATDKLVINSITIPPGMPDPDPSKSGIWASELISLINARTRSDRRIGKDIVTVLGKWDPTTGTAVGLEPDGKGNDFVLEPGVGYQLYVKTAYTLTLP